jgi:hypothetical protein
VWWKMLEAVFRAIGKVLSLARRIPIVDNWLNSIERIWLNPVVTHLVRDPEDPDLSGALELYTKRIPEDQRCAEDDMVRWIREDAEKRRLGNPALTDWFIVAKFRHRVCGFLLFHYSSAANLALIAYMVVGKTPGVQVNAVSAALGARVRKLLQSQKEFKECKGFIVEVEDPRKERDSRKRIEALARIRRFCTLAETQGFTLRALDFDYKQPRLSLEAPGIEYPLLLLSARVRRNLSASETARDEAIEALTFVYTLVYSDGYSPEPEENQAYARYCAELTRREISSLPDRIRALSSKQLEARYRNATPGMR